MWIVRLAWSRLWRRSSHVEVFAPLFIALSIGAVVLTSVTPTMQAASIQSTLSELPYVDHTLAANFDGTADSASFSTIESTAQSGLTALTESPISSLVTYRPVADGKTQTFHVMATDELASAVTLLDGRLPQSCSVTVCEVLSYAPISGDPLVAQYGFTIVGHATPRDPLLTDLTVQPELSVLYSSDPESIRNYEPLFGFPRTLTWAAQVDGSRITELGADSFLELATEQANLFSLTSPRMTLRVPDSAIKHSAERSGFAMDRILSLLLALTLAGLVSIALISATAKTDFRRDMQMLNQNGLSRRSLVTLSVMTAALPSALGIVIGVSVGAMVAQSWTKSLANVPLALGILSITLLLALVISTRIFIATSKRVDIGLILASAAALAITTSALRLDTWPIIIGLVGLVAAVGSVRILGRRFVSRKQSASPIRAGLVANNRTQLTAIAALLSLSSAIAVAMLSSISGLDRNITDTAQFASPVDFRITGLGRDPLREVSLTEYQALMGTPSPDRIAVGIKKVATTGKSSVSLGMPVSVISIPETVVSHLPDLSKQTGTQNSTLNELVRDDLQSLGQPIAQGKTLSLATDALNSTVDVIVWFINPERESESVTLTGDEIQSGDYSSITPGSALIGIELRENPDDLARRQHAMGEGDVQVVAPNGTAVLRDLRVDGQLVNLNWAAFAYHDGLAATPTSLTTSYNLDQTSLYLTNVATPSNVVAIVDPTTAAIGNKGSVVLTLPGGNPLPLTINTTMERFPTATPHFALVDSNTLDHLLAATDPASLNVAEVWLTREPSDRSDLESVQFTELVFTSQQDVIKHGEADPIRQWTARAQLVTLTLLLGFIALTIRLMTQTISRRTSWLAWEAQGVGPRAQRRALRFVLTSFSIASVLSALAIGAIASPFVSTLTRYNYGGDVAVPPLTSSTPWMWILSFLVITLSVNYILSSMTGRRTFSGDSGYEVTS